jgi:hypothetical protein
MNSIFMLSRRPGLQNRPRALSRATNEKKPSHHPTFAKTSDSCQAPPSPAFVFVKAFRIVPVTMASEETPLLVSDAELAHEALYNRFSPSRKRIIVALVSWSGILPSMSMPIYLRVN